jgi:hypothetical protein
VTQRTYALKPGPEPGANQLVAYDGSGSADTAVVDHVAGLAFEYYGDPQPPLVSTTASDPASESITYGPRPPEAGGNCAFAWNEEVRGHTPRLATLADPASRALIRLGAAELADGNAWCPDAAAAHGFDADLLRIRKVALTLRVESAVDALRGPVGPLFVHGGTGRNARRLLPDREIRVQVTPPNLNLRP